MLRFSRSFFALLAIAATAASAPAGTAEQAAAPQESRWAMRAPAAPAPGSAATQSAANAPKVEPPKITPEQREFAARMVAAQQAKDLAKMIDQVAPTVRACFNRDTQPFLDSMLKKQMRFPVPNQYQLRVGAVPPQVAVSGKLVTFPVPATQVLEIEFAEPDGTSVTLNRLIGQENGKWYAIAPCPTQAGLERFHQMEQVRLAGLERAKKLYARVTPALKAQILAYVAKHDNADAWKLCMKSLHVDFTTARELVSMVAGESTD